MPLEKSLFWTQTTPLCLDAAEVQATVNLVQDASDRNTPYLHRWVDALREFIFIFNIAAPACSSPAVWSHSHSSEACPWKLGLGPSRGCGPSTTFRFNKEEFMHVK